MNMNDKQKFLKIEKKEVAQETTSEFEEMCRIVEKEHPDWGWDAVASYAQTRLSIKKVGALRKYGGHDG